MKVIQIIPKEKKVIEIELNSKPITSGRLKEFQDLVGGNIETAHIIDENHRIFVNEEGLFEPDRHYFYYKGAHQPFAGNGIIVTENNEDVSFTVDEVFEKINFLNEQEIKPFLKKMGLEEN